MRPDNGSRTQKMSRPTSLNVDRLVQRAPQRGRLRRAPCSGSAVSP